MRRLILLALVLSLPQVAFAQADITFVSSTVDTTNASEYTFTNHAIGTEAADRCVVVTMHSATLAASVSITSLTIGGNAASVLYDKFGNNGSQSRTAAVGALLVASGTTATIVVDPSESMVRMRIGVYTLTGTADCTTLADSDFSEVTDPSVSLDVPENGSALGACTDVGTGTGTAWTGLTENYDNTDEATAMFSTGASADFATEQTGLTITCDSNSAADSAEIGIFVSWGPDGEAEDPVRSSVIGGIGGVF